MSAIATSKFPMLIIYMDQNDGRRRQYTRIMGPDEAAPPIPPNHAVVVKCADGDSGYIGDSPSMRDFYLPDFDD